MYLEMTTVITVITDRSVYYYHISELPLLHCTHKDTGYVKLITSKQGGTNERTFLGKQEENTTAEQTVKYIKSPNFHFMKQENKTGSRKGISGWMDAYYFSTIALPRKKKPLQKKRKMQLPNLSKKTDITVFINKNEHLYHVSSLVLVLLLLLRGIQYAHGTTNCTVYNLTDWERKRELDKMCIVEMHLERERKIKEGGSCSLKEFKGN